MLHKVSDNGKEFLGEVKKLCEENKVKQINSLPYTPTSQGLVERFNKTIKNMQKVVKKANAMIKKEDTSDINKGDHVRVSLFNPKSKLVKRAKIQYSKIVYEVATKSKQKVPVYTLVGQNKPYYHYQLLKVNDINSIEDLKKIEGKDDTYYHRKELGLNSN